MLRHRTDQHPGFRTPFVLAGPIVSWALLACLMSAGPARAQVIRDDFYITNGTVNAQALTPSTLYIGGSFSRIGPTTGSGVPLDDSTGLAQAGFARVVGEVDAVIPDGVGGWFLGGAFTSVGGVPRPGLAHILADHSVSEWNPGPNGAVRALYRSGDTLWVGGDFTSIAAVPRSRIAAIDATSGVALPWDPGANGTVRTLVAAAGVVYAGGTFTSIGGQVRNRIAALDAASGLATTFDPNANNQVLTIVLQADTLYAGGIFTSIGGQVRNRIAALDATTGLPLSWNPNANNQVQAIAISEGTLYAGGVFSAIGGQPRSRIAALALDTGLAIDWNPNANSTVRTLLASGGKVYVGGDFTSIGGQARSQIAALDTMTALATPWDPGAYGSVLALAADSGAVFAGGLFNGMGGLVRHNLAAVDVTTGVATAWDPNANQMVLALAIDDGTLYAAGDFIHVGGQPRNSIAALDTMTGLATDWNPSANGEVASLAVADSMVYAGGSFTVIGGQSRNRLAALDRTTGLASAWNPNANMQVLVIDVDGETVYAGGDFTLVGGQSRNRVAALDASTGLATAWNPNSNGTVRALVAACGVTYVGGFFSTIGGQNRNQIAAIEPSTGLATSWNPGANGPLFALALGEGTVYAGGVLNLIGGQVRNRIASLDPLTGLATPWNPNSSGTVRTLVTGGGSVYAGGMFASMGPLQTANVAGISADASATCPAIALAPTDLGSAFVGSPYAQTITASGGAAPYCFALVEGNLPAGTALTAGGDLSGTPTVAGAATFTVGVTDARGCSSTREYTWNVFVPGSEVAANAGGFCLSPAHPCATVPVTFSRADSTPVGTISVTFTVEDTLLSLCAPEAPATSIRAGSWLADFPNSTFEVADNGGGSYTVHETIFGLPCGPTAGGELFTVDVRSPFAGDGTGTITVTSVLVKDCQGAPLFASPGPVASIVIDNAAPPAIADLVAEPVTSGNPPMGTTGVRLTWTVTEPGAVRLYRAPFGSYPEYDEPGPVSPPDSLAAPGPPWELVDSTATSGLVDGTAPRGFWYYVATVTDSCGGVSLVSNVTTGTLNYHLGDVSSVPAGPGIGDNRVDGLDVSLLGLHYGIEEPEITNAGVAYLDVGPTTDLLPTSRPTTDDRIDFEDLMMFATNYQVVSAPQVAVESAPGGADEIVVSAPGLVEAGATMDAVIHFRGSGRLQGLSTELAWDPAVVAPGEMHPGSLVADQGGVVLTARPGTVDAALLGVRSAGLSGEGELARVHFRAIAAGDPAIRIARTRARDAANQPVDLTAPPPTVPAAPAPLRTALLAPRPNPFAHDATILFTLARSGPVELAIFSVDGRRVRRLLSESREAGEYRVLWDGRDDDRRAVASGVYYAWLMVAGQRFTARLVCVR